METLPVDDQMELAALTAEQEPVSPEQAFAAHVEEVRKYGDPTDALSKYSFRAAAVRTGALIIPLAELVWVDPWLVPTGILFGGSVVAIETYSKLRHHYWDFPKASNRLHAADELSEQTGQRMEFYRTRHTTLTGNHEVALHWHGPNEHADDPSDSIGNLLQTARLARSAGVDRMIISRDLVGGWIPDGTKEYGSFYKWLIVNKLRFSKPENADDEPDIVFEATPDEWLHLCMDARPSADQATLDGLLRKLAELNPNHIAVQAMVVNGHAPAKERNAVLHLRVREAIRQRFEDTDIRPRHLHDPDHAYPVPQKVSVTAMLEAHGETVHRIVGGLQDGRTTMAAATRLDDPAIAELLKTPQLDPARAEAAIELLIYRIFDDPKRARPHDIHGAATGSDEPMYQDQILNLVRANEAKKRISLDMHKAVRVGAAVLLAAGLATGVIRAQDGINNYRHSVETSVEYDIATASGLGGSYTGLPLDKVNHAVDAQNPALRVWDNINNWTHNYSVLFGGYDYCHACLIDDSLPQYDAQTPQRGSSLGQAGVNPGMGGLAPNFEEWKLREHDLSPKGYWAVMTSNNLYLHADKNHLVPEDMVWKGLYDTDAKPAAPPSAIDGSHYPDYIQVSGPISYNDVLQYDGNAAWPNGLGRFDSKIRGYKNAVVYIQVPILDGTDIVAVNYTYHNSKNKVVSAPVWVIDQPGGTKLLEINGNVPPGQLSYWIAPSYNYIHAVKPTVASGNFPANYTGIENYLASIDPDWARQSDEQHALYFRQYIQKNFGYNLQPLKPGELYHDRDMAQVVRTEMARRLAECSLANTIEALSDPGDLNVVTGYLNDGSALQRRGLWSHTLHLYTVDPGGYIFDAAPYKGAGRYKYFFDGAKLNVPEHSRSPAPFALAGLMLGGLGIGVWQRRRIGDGVRSARTEIGNKVVEHLAHIDAAELQAVIDLAQTQNYAASLDVGSVIARSKARSAAEAEKSDVPIASEPIAEKLVVRTDLHGRHAQANLRKARFRQSDTSTRTTLYHGIRAARAARYAHRILPRKKDSVVVNGLKVDALQ